MTDTQRARLLEAGYTWNTQHNCWLHSNGTNCIFTTPTEGQYQTGTIQEGTPVRNEGTVDFEAALVQPILAETDTTSGRG
jgi:hypothetical protein